MAFPEDQFSPDDPEIDGPAAFEDLFPVDQHIFGRLKDWVQYGTDWYLPFVEARLLILGRFPDLAQRNADTILSGATRMRSGDFIDTILIHLLIGRLRGCWLSIKVASLMAMTRRVLRRWEFLVRL